MKQTDSNQRYISVGGLKIASLFEIPDKTILFLGEIHNRHYECTTKLVASDFIVQCVRNLKSFDLFVEEKYDRKTKFESLNRFEKQTSSTPHSKNGYLEELMKKLTQIQCGSKFKQQKSSFTNFADIDCSRVRIHHIDVRWTSAPLLQFIYHHYHRIRSAHLPIKTSQYHISANYLREKSVPKPQNFDEFETRFWQELDESKILRQLQNIPEKYVRVRKLLLAELYESMKIFYKNWDTNRMSHNQHYESIYQYVMDIYGFARIFRVYRDGESAKNVIVYTGAAHTRTYIRWMRELEFTNVWQTESKTETEHCVQIPIEISPRWY